MRRNTPTYPTRADLDLRAEIQRALQLSPFIAGWSLKQVLFGRLGWEPRQGWFEKEMRWLHRAQIIRFRMNCHDGRSIQFWSLAPPKACALELQWDGSLHPVH